LNQAELLDRQERRAHELAAFKEKTQAILDTLGVKVRDVQLEETTNWLHGYIVNVVIQGVGVAFPLSNDDLQRHGSSGAVKAFLFSISSIAFTATRGETGEAVMKRLCFQFIPRCASSYFETGPCSVATDLTRIFPKTSLQKAIAPAIGCCTLR
jgi:hypothetical protein